MTSRRSIISKPPHRSRDTLAAPVGEIGKAEANIRGIRLLKQLEAEDGNPTPDEMRVLAQYVGWGGLPGALDEVKVGKRDYINEGWLSGDALKELLIDAEFSAA